MRWVTFSVIARFVAAGMLFNTLAPHQSDYTTVLHGIVCAACLCTASVASGYRQMGWIWSMVIFGLIYNPLLSPPFTLDGWHDVDFACGLFLLLSVPFIREGLHDTSAPHPAFLLLIGTSVLSGIAVWQNIELSREVHSLEIQMIALQQESGYPAQHAQTADSNSSASDPMAAHAATLPQSSTPKKHS